MHNFNTLAIECATKLAPYHAPKLESIEIKKKVTHRFVIKAPMIAVTAEQWLKDAGVNAKETILPPEKQKRINSIHPKILDNFIDLNAQ